MNILSMMFFLFCSAALEEVKLHWETSPEQPTDDDYKDLTGG